jgi:hypothetical protein
VVVTGGWTVVVVTGFVVVVGWCTLEPVPLHEMWPRTAWSCSPLGPKPVSPLGPDAPEIPDGPETPLGPAIVVGVVDRCVQATVVVVAGAVVVVAGWLPVVVVVTGFVVVGVKEVVWPFDDGVEVEGVLEVGIVNLMVAGVDLKERTPARPTTVPSRT